MLFLTLQFFCSVFLYGRVLDKMDSRREIIQDSGVVADLSISGGANTIAYDFATGDWIEIYKDTFANTDNYFLNMSF